MHSLTWNWLLLLQKHKKASLVVTVSYKMMRWSFIQKNFFININCCTVQSESKLYTNFSKKEFFELLNKRSQSNPMLRTSIFEMAQFFEMFVLAPYYY